MRSAILLISAICAGYVSALPQAAPAGGATCFDAGDCILSGGGTCDKAAGQLTGTCNKAAAAGGVTGTTGAGATGSAAADPLSGLLVGLTGGQTAGKGTGATGGGAGGAAGGNGDLLDGFQPIPAGIL